MLERITELETQLAFQEDTIAQLNSVITDQQGQIDNLREAIEQLEQKLLSLAEISVESNDNDPPPPHY